MTSLNFDVFFRDHGASRGLQQLGKDADLAAKRHEQFRKIAIGVGLGAAAAVIKFGKASVTAYSEAQRAQDALGFAFQKFPKLADTNQGALQKLNLELQKKTQFDHNSLASGQAVLAQFNLTGRQIMQVTPLLADYAAKTGQDIPDAAKSVGKALLGNTRALKAIGISYHSTGNAGQDFANITALMQQKIGGFAEHEGKTFSGQLAIFKNQFRDLEEAAGAKLVPALTGLVSGLTDVVTFVGENSRVIAPLVGVVGGLAAAVWLASKATKAWATTQAVFSTLGLKAVSGLNALKVAFTGVELSSLAAGRAMKIAQLSIPLIGIALFAVTTAMEFFASKSDTASTTANGFAEAMKTVEGNVTRATAALNENVRAQAVNELQTKGVYEQARLLGLSYQTVTDAALGNADAIAAVNGATSAAMALNPQLSKANADARNAAIGLSGSLNGVAHESIDAANAEQIRRSAMVTTTTTSGNLEAKTKELTAANKALSTAVQAVINKFTILKDGALSNEQADVAWQTAIDDLTASVKTNGRSLNIHSAAGRANRQVIVAMMTALNDEATATFKSTYEHSKARTEQGKLRDATKAAQRVLADGKVTIDKVAHSAHLNADEVHKMTGTMLKTPKQVRTDVTTPGIKAAQNNVTTLHDDINNLNNKKVTVGITVNTSLNALNRAIVKQYGKFAWKAGFAEGGVMPGYTPGRDVHTFYSPTAGQLRLSGGEAVMRPEWTRAVGGPAAVAKMNDSARSGQGPGFAGGGVVSRNIVENVGVHGRAVDYGRLRDYASSGSLAAAISMTRETGLQATREAAAAAVAAAKAAQSAAAAASGGGGGPIGKGGYASALAYARRHVGHPYIFGTLWDCSGFISALHSIILGQSPHRRYSTPAFHGAHAQGFTRGKRSPFMVGVNPSPGKFGHMAGTLNGVNVESAGGVGVRVGGRARGWNNGMFSWRGGLAKGGVIGDMPFDLLDPQGERYTPWLADLVHRAGYNRGGVIGGRGPERVLSDRQNRAFENLVRAQSRNGGGAGVTVNQYISLPNWLGSTSDLKRALVDMSRRGELAVITGR